MSERIRVGILGYGNIGKGVELSVSQNPDMELAAVFTRRKPESIKTVSESARVLHIDDICEYKDLIDVLILCGGSATDLPEQGPKYAGLFNCVDSFDTHARIPEYFNSVNEAAKRSGKTAAISIGWDPGLFSMNRLILEAILPHGESYTFWGKGVSQGHSDAIRRVKGVKNGIQYTIPVESVIERIRNGERPSLTTGDKHIRECFVVAEEGADKAEIEATIKNMPNYFADYKTIVHFISEDELIKNHSRMPHGGFVIRSGDTGKHFEKKHIAEFSLKLESNPEFTACVLTAYARAVVRLNREGKTGALTVFDIPIGYLSPKSAEELRKELL
ncbi:MAG: diaminopimelate dehydrogenase [Clostridiaceae bacterium]|nr:diaminopimelate dehydrogenase [Clostridiaceae bacterium]